MNATHAINVDLAKVYKGPGKGAKYLNTLAWGDPVELIGSTAEHLEIKLTGFTEQSDGSILPQSVSGFIRPAKSSKLKPMDLISPIAVNKVLKVDFVDVQQGDAAVIETPKGKVILVDGGDVQLFARYLAARYPGTSLKKPQKVECILISHGDADHFAGLPEILESETNSVPRKRMFMQPKRVYHNGLVKRPSSVAEVKSFGKTQEVEGETIITGLEENLLQVSEAEMNKEFREWKKTLKTYDSRSPVTFRRLAKGDDNAFDFLKSEKIKVKVLGPLLTEKGAVRGLRFLGTPPKGPRVELKPGERPKFTGKSASHTINGHSVIFRLEYGKFHFLFAGDLNEEAEFELSAEHQAGEIDLNAEVFKVPHHGSADFLPQFIRAVAPVVSVISSGDENSRKEYIHPRAPLVGSLGRYSRVSEPLIFVTELVAFFKTEGFVKREFHKVDQKGELLLKSGKAQVDEKLKKMKSFFGFSRTAYGIVRVRTDGERLLVFTNSGQADLKEAYAFRMLTGEGGVDEVRADEVRMV